jgi:hypothetical protein
MNTTSGSEGDDPLKEAKAYNHSIYLMVSMPYLLLGTFGLIFYWKTRTGRRASLPVEKDPSLSEIESPINSDHGEPGGRIV